MKKTALIALGLALTYNATAHAADLKTVEQKASYTLGADLAVNFEQQGLDIDIKALTAGMQDAMNKKPMQLTKEEMEESISAVKKQIMQKQVEARKLQGEANAKQGKEFLAANAKKDGVKTTASGLQYKVLKAGTGPSPTEDNKLTAHYEGRLIDGTVFDSSFERGTPLEFYMNNVIKGWQEALSLMNRGAKWEVYIPSELAYGEKGAGKRIGPNSTLIFTVELIMFAPDEK
ncbi:MAG: FKBP-type peptidyl-prolyl cis-trans isomerase [Pseudomonadota bacterium]|nr:FKBP-type peptidyl-prolyl cis-trans isomerase [Pseudomonadota bacterium]